MSNTSAKNQRYLIIWRWHFYAGVLVTPFLILLAATGLAMLLSANIQGKEKERLAVAVGQSVQPHSSTRDDDDAAAGDAAPYGDSSGED